MKKLITAVAVCVLTACSSGQRGASQSAAKQPDKQPGTAIEAFLGTHGRMIVKDSYDLGRVASTGAVVMDALVIYEPNSSQKNKGLRVEVTEAGSLERSNISFIDLDELDSLSKALAYMSDLAGKWNGQAHDAYTEVIYVSKGEFEVGFYQKGKQRSAFCKSGSIGATTAFLRLDDISTLKALVDKAAAVLATK